MEDEVTKTEPSTEAPAIPRWKKHISEKYPDRQFADDSEAENAFYEDYESTNSKLADAELNNKKVYELIEANPALADVIVAMSEGLPFEIALARNVDLEAIMPTNGEPNFEMMQQEFDSRKKRLDESRKRIETVESNREKSSQTAQEFYASKKMGDTEVSEFMDFVDNLFDGIFNGDISRKTLEKLYQAYKYEEDVQGALEQGEVNGRNEKIEVKRETSSKTDGLPEPGGSIAAQTEPKPKKQIFNL